MQKFMRGEVEVQAFQWDGRTIGLLTGGEAVELGWPFETVPELAADVGHPIASFVDVWREGSLLYLRTVDNTIPIEGGCWIVIDDAGDIYACLPDNDDPGGFQFADYYEAI